MQGASATQLAGPPEGKEIGVEILASREVWAQRALGPGRSACADALVPTGDGLCGSFGFRVNAPQF